MRLSNFLMGVVYNVVGYTLRQGSTRPQCEHRCHVHTYKLGVLYTHTMATHSQYYLTAGAELLSSLWTK